MTRIFSIAIIALALAGSEALAQTTQGAAAQALYNTWLAKQQAQQQCPAGQRLEPRVGFDQFECRNCRMRRDPQGGTGYIEFLSEPVLRGVGNDGLLRDGDVLLAVNDQGILTAQGAKTLATLSGTSAAQFKVRRRGAELTVSLKPEFVCKVQTDPSFSWSLDNRLQALDFGRLNGASDTLQFMGNLIRSLEWNGAYEGWKAGSDSLIGLLTGKHVQLWNAYEPSLWVDKRPGGWFGFALSCDSCSTGGADRRGAADPAWPGALFNSNVDVPPQIVQIDSAGPAAKAGLRVGDLLVSINGTAIATEQGREKFLATDAGDTVVFRYSRDQTIRTARVVAGQRPANVNVMRGARGSFVIGDPVSGTVMEVTGADVTITEGPNSKEMIVTGKDLRIVIKQVSPGTRREF